jgi:Protein of unknown function (DUF2652)
VQANYTYKSKNSTRICHDYESIINPALIIIPDISGFVEFMNNSDLTHSQIKIALLLESILESNEIGLKVSEIEGDAILFYSFNNNSTRSEILEQCLKMFNRFHETLQDFKKMDCQCGSCQKLQQLSLKFILHHGHLGSVMVKKYCKLYGRDLIIAHRLLKNSVQLKEYILITENFSTQYQAEEILKVANLSNPKKGHKNIKNIGKTNYSYYDLKPGLERKINPSPFFSNKQ